MVLIELWLAKTVIEKTTDGEIVNPITTGIDLLTAFLQEVWFWILNNILTPIILLVALALFFYFQYLIFKVYIYLIKYFFSF